MIRYQIAADLSAAGYTSRDNVSVTISLEQNVSPVMADHGYYLDRYGFEISGYEIEHYKAHYNVWQHFVNQPDAACCLIYEAHTCISADACVFEELKEQLPDDWEMFFPFNRFDEKSRQTAPATCASILGYYIGCPAYFISRKGALKLLEQTVIRQPLDEELLDLSLSDKLTADFSETNWFTCDLGAAPAYKARMAALKQAVFNVPGWNNEHKTTARKIIRLLTSYCHELGIDLILHAGSLIGGIRHGGIMPWDDDIDFAIHHLQVSRLIKRIEADGILCIKPFIFRKTNSVYHKCWMKEEGEITEGFEHRFPFVDLWLFYDQDEAGYIIHKEGHRYPVDICLPLKQMEFEGSIVQIPHDPLATLDLQYPGWREHIEVYSWCHRLKGRTFRRFILPIQVNESGRMIQE